MPEVTIVDSWTEYRKLVLSELEFLKGSLEDTISRLNTIEKDAIINKGQIQDIFRDEMSKVKNRISEIMDEDRNNTNDNFDRTDEKIQKLDIRLNTVETKMVIYCSLISGAVGLLTSFGRTLLEMWFK